MSDAPGQTKTAELPLEFRLNGTEADADRASEAEKQLGPIDATEWVCHLRTCAAYCGHPPAIRLTFARNREDASIAELGYIDQELLRLINGAEHTAASMNRMLLLDEDKLMLLGATSLLIEKLRERNLVRAKGAAFPQHAA